MPGAFEKFDKFDKFDKAFDLVRNQAELFDDDADIVYVHICLLKELALILTHFI